MSAATDDPDARLLRSLLANPYHPSVIDEGMPAGEKLSLVELYPWRTRAAVVKEVTIPAGDVHRVVKVRIRAGVKNGNLLRLPGGPDLRVKLLIRRTVLHLLVAAVVLAGLSTGAIAVPLLLAGTWVLLQFCRKYTRSARGITANAWRGAGPPKASGFRYYLCDFGILYLVPIGIAIAFYVLLATYLFMFGGSLSIDQLIGLQQSFEGTSKYFDDNLKLSEVKVLGLLVLIYVLSCVLLAGRRQGKVRVGVAKGLHWSADLYGKCSGPISVGLATLAAFSLFGMQLGTPSKDLHLRIKIQQEGYAEVAKAVEAKMSQQVTSMLYIKISNALPADYLDALRLPTLVDDSVTTLRAQADHASKTFGVSDPAVDQAVRNEEPRMQKVRNLPTVLTVNNSEQRTSPGTTTPDQVEAAKAALAYQSQPGVEIITEGQKKIVFQVEKLATEQLVNVTKTITDAVPILEPLLQSFVEAVDKSLQDRLENAYNSVLLTLLSNPGVDLDTATAQEAASLVSETDVTGPVSKAKPQATRLAGEWRGKASTLQSQATVTGLIDDLGGSGAKQAAEQLLTRGSSLSESHVQQLIFVMENGTGLLRRNAAVVVGRIPSAHVSQSQRDRAKTICGCP